MTQVSDYATGRFPRMETCHFTVGAVNAPPFWWVHLYLVYTERPLKSDKG